MAILPAQTSFIDLPSLYAFGLDFSTTNPGTKILNLQPGQVRSQFNEFDIVISSAISVDSTKNGINGLDTGTVAANTWYAVYVIYDSTLALPSGALISCQQLTLTDSQAAPVLPFGYSHYRRVGYALTDSSSNFLPFQIAYSASPNAIGNNCYRYYQWYTPIKVLDSGISQTPTFALVTLSSAVPYNECGSINLSAICRGDTGSAIDGASIRSLGSTQTYSNCPINLACEPYLGVAVPNYPSCWINPISNSGLYPALEYCVSGGAYLSIWVNGFYDTI